MTDYADLVQRLRGPIKHPQQLINASYEAANTIEYLAAEENHLWTKINKMTVVIKRMDARIDELEAALKPFAEASDVHLGSDDMSIAFRIIIGNLRQARKVLGENE
jgi:hypothetical protein